MSLLFTELAGNFAKVVEQYGTNVIRMKNSTGIHTVADLCEIMLKPDSSPVRYTCTYFSSFLQQEIGIFNVVKQLISLVTF